MTDDNTSVSGGQYVFLATWAHMYIKSMESPKTMAVMGLDDYTKEDVSS